MHKRCIIMQCFMMIPGSKGLNPHELAHEWVRDLGTRPNIRQEFEKERKRQI